MNIFENSVDDFVKKGYEINKFYTVKVCVEGIMFYDIEYQEKTFLEYLIHNQKPISEIEKLLELGASPNLYKEENLFHRLLTIYYYKVIYHDKERDVFNALKEYFEWFWHVIQLFFIYGFNFDLTDKIRKLYKAIKHKTPEEMEYGHKIVNLSNVRALYKRIKRQIYDKERERIEKEREIKKQLELF